MKKNNRKNTVKAAAVTEVGNTSPVQQTVAETVNTPEVQASTAEKATNDQLKLIGRAVKANKISRFAKEDWNALTKDAAAKIISENHLNEEQTPSATLAKDVKTVTIKDPDAKATRAQLQLIGHAVKAGKIARFNEEKWATLTKGEASAIIDKHNLAADDGAPASNEQKEKLSELVKEGFLRGFGHKFYKTITKKVASQFIRWGLYRKDNGIKAEQRRNVSAAMIPALATAGAGDDINYDEIPF